MQLGIVAWNFGNLKSILPDYDDAFLNLVKDKGVDINLMKRMINYKVINFKQYTNFIVDYDLVESKGEPILKIITQEEQAYHSNVVDKIGNEDSQEQFEENYVNRCAITLKHLHPFNSWITKLYPDDSFEEDEISTYLIDSDIDDLESWLQKKYDKLFTFELQGYSTNIKDWTQKRTYNMFKEWFRVEISTLVYDLEKAPILKVE